MTTKEKHPGGRPTKLTKDVKKKLELIYNLGVTDAQAAEIIGITEQTINNWKNKDPEFFGNAKNGSVIRFRTPKKRKKNSETAKQYAKKYYQENKTKFRLSAARRESIKKSVVSDLSEKEWDEVLVFFDNKCAYCGCGLKMEMEHVIPVDKGGGFTRTNIVPACRSCNRSKTNWLLHEWYKHSSVYDVERLLNIVEWIYGKKDRKEIEVRFRVA